MYGFELIPFFRFCVQVFAVVAASASLWGAAFAIKAKREDNIENKRNWHKLARALLVIFTTALILFLSGWWVLALMIFPAVAAAHEGVVRAFDYPSAYIQNGFNANLFWIFLLVVFNFFAAILYLTKKRLTSFFEKYIFVFFLTNFLLFSAIISLTLFSGSLGAKQIILSLHNWHSILTLGTVIIVDIIYLYTINKNELKKALYPFFPFMSLFIWMGLGIDFITSISGLDHGFPKTAQFIFNQIVVVIIILNGTMLSVRINNKLIELVSGAKVLLAGGRWLAIMQISGSVSIISWFTITFLDFFNFTFSLWQFFFMYVLAIFIAVIANFLIEKMFLREVK